MTKTLLVIAAGPLQVPAIEEASRLGMRTVAVDVNPLAPGMALANAPYAADIFDVVAIEKIARAEKIDGVMTLCTDAPVRIVAAVAAALGLPAISPEAAANATDKRLMRKALLSNGAPVPGFSEVGNIDAALLEADTIGYPVALKIARSSGSRGVYRVDSPEDLTQRFIQARTYQPHGNLLLEEWMDGPEVSVEGACCGGRVHIIQVTDKLLFPGAFPVEAGHTQPSRLSLLTVAQIRAATESGVRSLGFDSCAFHAELKITRDGPKIVEIGARLGGDRISTHLTPLSTGVNLVRATIQIAVGQTPDLVPNRARGAAVRYFYADECGTVERIEGLDKLPSLPGLELLYAESERDGPLGPGFEIGEIRSSLDRYGHVLFSGDSADQAAERAEQAASMVKFHFRATR
jgi:biotin carboxylase